MHLFRYCAEHGITFTRSRPYRKNDNCYVEQKNWPVVRQQVGYARYDTPRARGLGRAVSGAPAVRELLPAPDEARGQDPSGVKVTERYDPPGPRTSGSLPPPMSQEAKDELRTHLALNPAQLKRRIGACQDRLIEIGSRTKPQGRKEVSRPPDHPFRRVFSPKQISRTSLVSQPVSASRTS